MKYLHIFPIITSIGLTNLYAGTMGPIGSDYDFNGFYVGLGTGFNTVFIKNSFSTTRSDGVGGQTDKNRYTHSAVLFTGNVGYGTMLKEKTYIGAKASIYYSPLNTTDETTFSIVAGTNLVIGNNSIWTTMKPSYNIDAVLGYEPVPHVLPFVEAGVTFADVHHNYRFARTRTGNTTHIQYDSYLNLDSYKTGYNVGIGLNYQAQQNWIFSTELVYSDLGQNSGLATVTIPGTTAIEAQSRTIKSNDIALFGSISYLFNC